MPNIAINNIRLYYEEYGQGDDVLILLHGFLSSSNMWKKDYIPKWAQRHKVFAIDMRGHGGSHGVKVGCNLTQMADDIHRFAIKKNLITFTLAGMSMGGAIAIQYAIRHPDILNALFLLSPGPGSVFSKGFFLIAPLLILLSQNKTLLKPFLKSALIRPLPKDILSDFTDDAVLVSKETWLQYLNPKNKIQQYEKLRELTVPTLVIIGAKDKTVPVSFQKDVAAIIPGASTVLMADEGHALTLERPDVVLTAIKAFQEEHGTSGNNLTQY